MKTENVIRPFANLCQFGDWEDANCYRCEKFDPKTHRDCGFFEMLAAAFWGNGAMTMEDAAKIGFRPGMDDYVWQCPELQRRQELPR